MFLAQKFCRIEQYNLLGRGEIRSAQGHVFCGSAFARYVHVLKENAKASEALGFRKFAFLLRRITCLSEKKLKCQTHYLME